MSGGSAAGGDFLARMAAASRRRLELARSKIGEAQLRQRIAGMPAPPAPRFNADAFQLIAEVKRRSPSAGQLANAELTAEQQARQYAAGGAITISVLTEPEEFSGELAHVTQVARALPGIAVMRKDFLVSPYQVLEARAAGAAGVLLIAAMLEPREIQDMLATVLDLDMFALVEVFDQADIERCASAVQAAAASAQGRGRVLIGVNCRDLRSLEVDFGRFARLAPQLPAGVPRVAESGITSPAQAAEVAGLGYSIALVGTALMRSGDATASARALLQAGRQALAARRG